MYQNRLVILLEEIARAGIDNILMSDPSSIEYYTGYKTDPGERLLLLSISNNGSQHLYLNYLFPKPSQIDSEINIHYYEDGEEIIQKIYHNLVGNKIAVDKLWPSHFLLDLMSLDAKLDFSNGSLIVDKQRAVKSPEEQEWMRQSSRLNDQAMSQIIQNICGNQTEKDMVVKLSNIYQTLGCNGFSFEPIIAYGKNGADPHHETSNDLPQRGESIVIDIGGYYQGYASDMTRTVFYGQPSPESIRIYELVKQANEAAIALIRPGIPFSEIDLTARKIISDGGYGKYFTHRLGHFIGKDVHEAGDVSQHNHSLTQIGQIFSIEPGIYLPGKVGVRIEDLVIVTEDGCEVLNHYPKNLIVIDPK